MADGGGLSCHSGSSPSIKDCIVTENSGVSGGGLYCNSSSPNLNDCTISGNQADSGGGICCLGSSPTVKGCVISENTSVVDGGGFMCRDYSSPTVIRCTIEDNQTSYGGGIFCENKSSPVMRGCIITGNQADHGGGIFCYRSSLPNIDACVISTNTVTGEGGGIRCDRGSLPIINSCTLSFNSAAKGGGVFFRGSTLTLTNCTFSGNRTTSGGGILFIGYDLMVTNTILWDDSPDEINALSGSTFVTYSNVMGGWTGEGNIDIDPLFNKPWAGDLHLRRDSPCIDTGTPEGAPDFDIDGDERPLGAGFDMGSDEHTSLAIEVLNAPTEVVPGDSLSWEVAITNTEPTTVSIDLIQLVVDGTMSATTTIWSDYGVFPPGNRIEVWFDIGVPRLVPPGHYTCATVAYYQDEFLGQGVFDCDVVEE